MTIGRKLFIEMLETAAKEFGVTPDYAAIDELSDYAVDQLWAEAKYRYEQETLEEQPIQ